MFDQKMSQGKEVQTKCGKDVYRTLFKILICRYVSMLENSNQTYFV